MTCIIGLVDSGVVFMGADSAASDGWVSRPVSSPKVFIVGEFLIGYTTSFRMGQLLQYHLAVQPQQAKTDNLTYVVTEFAEKARALFKDLGFSTVKENTETGGTFLVGYRGQLYGVQNDFSVLAPYEGFDSVGAGYCVALGAMQALEGVAPKKRVRQALKIAAQFTPSVCGPFHILKK